MTSFFSQASPPPQTSPLSTPPPSPLIKRKRDQTLSPGRKYFFDSSLWIYFTNKIIPRAELQNKETLGT